MGRRKGSGGQDGGTWARQGYTRPPFRAMRLEAIRRGRRKSSVVSFSQRQLTGGGGADCRRGGWYAVSRGDGAGPGLHRRLPAPAPVPAPRIATRGLCTLRV